MEKKRAKQKTKAKKPPGRPRTPGPVLPIYDSMASCAASTGIPMPLLRRAKKGGCSAFRANRVNLGDLLPWLFASPDVEAVGNWKDIREEYQAKRERLKYHQDEKRVIERDVVRSAIQKGVAAIFTSLDRVMISELPPRLKGLDELAIRERCLSSISEIREALRAEFASIGAGEEEPGES